MALPCSAEKPDRNHYQPGDLLYFVGATMSFASGNRVVHGARGEVVGPSMEDLVGEGLQMMFPGNASVVNCYFSSLAHEPPGPLPGGYAVGEPLYYLGACKVLGSGDRLLPGLRGEVMGPAMGARYKGLALSILFPENKGNVACLPQDVTREPPPPLLGGFLLAEKLFYTGPSKTLASGERFLHGSCGEVAGLPSNKEHQGKGLEMLFPGHRRPVNCYLTSLTRDVPSILPGGFRVGEMLYYIGASETLPNGDYVQHGGLGEVIGPATVKSHRGKGLRMAFPGTHGAVNCPIAELSREAPKPLLGGYKVGDMLYFIGMTLTLPSGEELAHGACGKVVGPGKDEYEMRGLAIAFPEVKGNVDCFFDSLSKEPPAQSSTDLPLPSSATAPPPPPRSGAQERR